MRKVESVKILPGCISCGTCQAICPEVFEMEDISKVKEGIDLERNKDCIEQAIQICPVGVIKAEWSDEGSSE